MPKTFCRPPTSVTPIQCFPPNDPPKEYGHHENPFRVPAAIVASVVLAFVGPGFGAERAGGFDPITEKSIDSIFAPWDNTRSPGCAIAISRRMPETDRAGADE
jgi:hypothetical protein